MHILTERPKHGSDLIETGGANMLHKEKQKEITEKEKLLAFVNSLTQEEVAAILANFGQIVASMPAYPLTDSQDRTSQDQ